MPESPKDREARIAAKMVRRANHYKRECDILLAPVEGIDTIIQVGIGHWREGEHLLRRFPNARYLGIEPVERYVREAKGRGYPGEIVHGCAWSRSGEKLTFTEHRDKTSVFVKRAGGPIVSVATYTLDELFGQLDLGSIFLWMDCEGAEAKAMDGAPSIISKSKFILCETNSNAAADGYATTGEIVEWLKTAGFEIAAQYRATALFRRSGE